jgi:glycogen debranching enzyme
MTAQNTNRGSIDEATRIAMRDLRACYFGRGILAGTDHFDDFWARDSFFASWGALTIGDVERAKNNIDLFLSYQKKDGIIPRRLDRFYFTRVKYLVPLRIRRPVLRPLYQGYYPYPNIDPNPLLIITAERYYGAMGDAQWLRERMPRFIDAACWILTQDINSDGLIEEGALSNWMDTIKKFKEGGAVLYSNILAWEAIGALERMARAAGHVLPQELKDFRGALFDVVNKTFWNGNYFSDWKHGGKVFDYFSADGNLLAMVFGFADEEQQKKIFAHMRDVFGDVALPPPTNHPAYLERYMTAPHRILQSGYQNAYGRWLWLAAANAVALCRAGDTDAARRAISIMAEWIARSGAVYEIYTPEGLPRKSWPWRNERPFAWSAGMFLWALQEIKKKTAL